MSAIRSLAAGLALLALAGSAASAHEWDVGYWREQLSSPSPAARMAAARGIALTGRQAATAVPELVAALDDEDAAVRGAVIHALRDIGSAASEAAIPLARRLALEEDPDNLRGIARALTRFGDGSLPAVPALVDALHGPDETGRRMACRVLGDLEISAPVPVHELVQVMLRDPDTRVRSAARSALQEAGVDLAGHVDVFLAALQDEAPDVRESAVDWLGEMRPRPAQAVDRLVDVLLEDESLRVREEAETTLRDYGTEASSAVPRLLHALQGGSREQRQSAAAVLGSVTPGDERDVDALVTASIHDRELSVRLWARGALVRMARTNPATFERFIEVAGSPGPAEKRAALIDTLGRLGAVAAPAVPGLLVAMREGTEEVREEAARALGRIGAPAVDALLPLKRAAAWDRSQRVRDASDRAIKGIRRSIERLEIGEPEPESAPDSATPPAEATPGPGSAPVSGEASSGEPGGRSGDE